MHSARFPLSFRAAKVAAQGEKSMIKKILLGLTVAAFAFAGGASAQGIKRTPLQKIDFPEGYTTVTAIAEVPAGGAAGRHSHPGVETGYVLEGELELDIDGKPPLKLKAGDSYQIPAGAIHDAKAGDKPFKVLGIYIVDKTKPLATPAP
jgi:quercetin dioxygenase-like cupin family protein